MIVQILKDDQSLFRVKGDHEVYVFKVRTSELPDKFTDKIRPELPYCFDKEFWDLKKFTSLIVTSCDIENDYYDESNEIVPSSNIFLNNEGERMQVFTLFIYKKTFIQTFDFEFKWDSKS